MARPEVHESRACRCRGGRRGAEELVAAFLLAMGRTRAPDPAPVFNLYGGERGGWTISSSAPPISPSSSSLANASFMHGQEHRPRFDLLDTNVDLDLPVRS
jgi:hypothetical protein